MKTILKVLMCTGFAMTATGAFAQDAMKKGDAMGKDAMAKPMTMQQCKDHMAMAKSDPMKKDVAMDKSCSDMMKKDGAMMKDGGMMKKDGMAMEPPKK